MNELIKYFEQLEARIAALEEANQTNEALIAALEAEVAELNNRPLPEPQVVEKVVEKIVEVPVTSEPIRENPIPSEPIVEPEHVVEEPQPVAEEPQPASVAEEPASPKAAIYGKPVDDIRQAISLGDRFL